MKSAAMTFALATVLAGPIAPAFAQSADDPMPVTVDNFTRAETDVYLASLLKSGPLGQMNHSRELADIANQTVIRMNRDTLYSFGAFDLDAGTVTLTMPDPGDRFQSVLLINQDHYVIGVHYGGGSVTVTKDDAGTRYFVAAVRIFVDPSDPGDLDKVHALQDQMKVEQASAGTFEIPAWDKASQDKVRTALLELAEVSPFSADMFGSKDEVDPVHHLIGTAAGWGGNPAKDATYVGVTPPMNDGKTIYKLHVGNDVPVDGFWSVSVYNAKGYFEPNSLNAYSLNNVTAVKSSDGSFDIQFGGCDGKIPNCLPIEAGWNYTVRLYQPRAEILDGTWKFPEAQPVS